jgi:photosystem II stability/assembly factor-like uncharacterized protein
MASLKRAHHLSKVRREGMYLGTWLLLMLGTSTTVFSATEVSPQPAPVARQTFQGSPDDEPDERLRAILALHGGHPTEQDKQRYIRELALQRARFPDQIAGANYPADMPVWKSLGPRTAKYEFNGVAIAGIDSGRIRTVLTDPNDSDHVYVLTSGGGLWMTKEFSAPQPTWRVLTDGILSTSGGSVAFGRDPRTLYLGVGDFVDNPTAIGGVMLKSTDGGRTWGPFVSLPGAYSVREVKVDTSGARDVVLAATDVGLFRSSDEGATYQITDAGQADAKVSAWSLVRSSQGWLLTSLQATDIAVGSGNLYLSNDRGVHWEAIVRGANPFPMMARATLAVARPGDRIVYAVGATTDGESQADVFRSNDGGLRWQALRVTRKRPTNPNCFQRDMNLLNGQAWYNQAIVVSPSDPKRNTLYVGGQFSSAKTTDGGRTWTLISDWLPTGCDFIEPRLPYVHADFHTAVIDVVDGTERLILGTDGGIFVSEDGGQSFDSSANTGIVSLLAQTISSTPHRDDSAITGAQDDGTRARLGASRVWNQVFGGDGEGLGWSQANNAVTLASAEYVAIVRQNGLAAGTGDPNNWEDGTSGINFHIPDCFPFYTSIATPTAAADPTGLVFYTATGSRLYKTVDGARHWSPVAKFGTREAPDCAIQETLTAIGLHPVDPDRLALAGISGRIFVTNNGGVTWETRNVFDSLPDIKGGLTTVRWASGQVMYALDQNRTFTPTRVIRSTDEGLTWSRADTGLPDLQVWDIVADPRDPRGRTAYAGTDLGVYVTRNGGSSWALFGAGLPVVRAQGLYLSPTEDFLRIATYGRGVWEIDTHR